MKILVTLFFLCHAASAVKYSLKFMAAGTSGKTNLPDFVCTASVDKVEIGYFDSIKREVESKQDWIQILFKERPELPQLLSQMCLYNQQIFKATMEVFKQSLNKTEGSHVLQRISGCEWDDESDEVKGFEQYGYDGEDFISLDLQAMTWTASKSQAIVIKHLWDADKGRLKYIKDTNLSVCPKLLKDNKPYRIFLERTERPSVSFLQKTPSSLVSCHATGFYPDRADLFWRKDGGEIHEGVEKGQILPNHDGTFQMSTELNVSLIKHEDWRRYECVFQLSGLTEDIVTTLNKGKIQTNRVSPSEFPVGPVLGGAAGVVLLLVLSGLLYCCWRRNDFQPVHGGPGKEDGSSSKQKRSKASQEVFLMYTKNTQKHDS